MAEFVIITGLSGAGRSNAGATLEDLGWYVVDNLPTQLIIDVADLAMAPGSTRHRVVLVVGRDTEQLEHLQTARSELERRGVRVRTVFLDASDEVLVRRFEGTRRRHPLGREKVLEAIALERQRLASFREDADIVIDTTDLNVNQLRERLVALFTGTGPGTGTGAGAGVGAGGAAAEEPMLISVMSFGFKFGIPLDVDCVFDVRFLPNPHWVPELKELTGLDERVRDYVLGQPEAVEFADRVDDLLSFLLPSYIKEGKSYLTVGVGCTGGRHRSVVLAGEIAARIRKSGYGATVFHRDEAR